MGVPQNGWFTMEDPTSIYGNPIWKPYKTILFLLSRHIVCCTEMERFERILHRNLAHSWPGHGKRSEPLCFQEHPGDVSCEVVKSEQFPWFPTLHIIAGCCHEESQSGAWPDHVRKWFESISLFRSSTPPGCGMCSSQPRRLHADRRFTFTEWSPRYDIDSGVQALEDCLLLKCRKVSSIFKVSVLKALNQGDGLHDLQAFMRRNRTKAHLGAGTNMDFLWADWG